MQLAPRLLPLGQLDLLAPLPLLADRLADPVLSDHCAIEFKYPAFDEVI